jgi:polyhydroxybutyrate depolymerase
MKTRFKWLVHIPMAILGLAANLGLGAAVAYLLGDRTNGSLVSSGEKRRYLLYVPKRYNPVRPAALVISIHGYAEWPAHQIQLTRWNNLAERSGFLVVYPSGLGLPRRWRTNGTPGGDRDPLLEVRFISDLIDKLAGQYNIDPDRIYANGLSNGGGMSFVLACKLSGRIAAIGAVSGAYLLQWSSCQPSRPVPAIIFHGTADPVVPYLGGPSPFFNLPFPSVPDWVEALARQTGCSDTVMAIPTHGDVSGVRYNNCTTNAEVVFYSIAGGGHAWPGGRPLPKFLVGHTSMDIDATETMWAFFEAHPMPEKKSLNHAGTKAQEFLNKK